MTFDLRLPIGLVFTLFGLMLTGYGAISDPGIYDRCLGINLNLIWGGVVLIFGLWMLIMALSARRKRHTGKP
jgi:hypothetical protein